MRAAQTFLDAISRHIAQGDFDGYAQKVALPFVVITEERTEVHTDEDALRRLFDRISAQHRADPDRQVLRVAKTEHILAPGLRSCLYETHIFEGTYRVSEPYDSILVLRGDGAAQKALMVTNRVAKLNWQDHGNAEPPEPGNI